ncbi:hypothetical protein [Pseudotabrizicola sp. L79]|uniref:hypothetical protein n=1 Tax=Pseudotabrizicola sp. L79 TaxID=3118402 RepID=UPI002F94A1FA
MVRARTRGSQIMLRGRLAAPAPADGARVARSSASERVIPGRTWHHAPAADFRAVLSLVRFPGAKSLGTL